MLVAVAGVVWSRPPRRDRLVGDADHPCGQLVTTKAVLTENLVCPGSPGCRLRVRNTIDLGVPPQRRPHIRPLGWTSPASTGHGQERVLTTSIRRHTRRRRNARRLQAGRLGQQRRRLIVSGDTARSSRLPDGQRGGHVLRRHRCRRRPGHDPVFYRPREWRSRPLRRLRLGHRQVLDRLGKRWLRDLRRWRPPRSGLDRLRERQRGIEVYGDAAEIKGARADANGFAAASPTWPGSASGRPPHTIPRGTNVARGNDDPAECSPTPLC